MSLVAGVDGCVEATVIFGAGGCKVIFPVASDVRSLPVAPLLGICIGDRNFTLFPSNVYTQIICQRFFLISESHTLRMLF